VRLARLAWLPDLDRLTAVVTSPAVGEDVTQEREGVIEGIDAGCLSSIFFINARLPGAVVMDILRSSHNDSEHEPIFVTIRLLISDHRIMYAASR
jgi:hypothetical protein